MHISIIVSYRSFDHNAWELMNRHEMKQLKNLHCENKNIEMKSSEGNYLLVFGLYKASFVNFGRNRRYEHGEEAWKSIKKLIFRIFPSHGHII